MTEKKRIVIEANDMTYMQRLTYEVDSRQRIISTLIENHAFDSDTRVLTSPAFMAYHKQLDEINAEFELAKIGIADKYLPDEFKGNENAQWQLDFSTGEMVIFAA